MKMTTIEMRIKLATTGLEIVTRHGRALKNEAEGTQIERMMKNLGDLIVAFNMTDLVAKAAPDRIADLVNDYLYEYAPEFDECVNAQSPDFEYIAGVLGEFSGAMDEYDKKRPLGDLLSDRRCRVADHTLRGYLGDHGIYTCDADVWNMVENELNEPISIEEFLFMDRWCDNLCELNKEGLQEIRNKWEGAETYLTVNEALFGWLNNHKKEQRKFYVHCSNGYEEELSHNNNQFWGDCAVEKVKRTSDKLIFFLHNDDTMIAKRK